MAPAGEIFVLRSKFVLGPWKFDLCKRTVNMIYIVSVLSNHFAFLQKHVVNNLFICFMNKQRKDKTIFTVNIYRYKAIEANGNTSVIIIPTTYQQIL